MSRTAVQRKSDAQEKRTAAVFGGRVNPLSGAGWKSKADVRTPTFLIENKTKMDPNAKSYSVKALDLRDLAKHAIMEGRIGMLQFDLAGHSYCILRQDDLLELIGEEDD